MAIFSKNGVTGRNFVKVRGTVHGHANGLLQWEAYLKLSPRTERPDQILAPMPVLIVWSDQTHELHITEEQRGTSLRTWEYLSEC